MRAALAQALFIEPDILLLVCPFLDLKSQLFAHALLFYHHCMTSQPSTHAFLFHHHCVDCGLPLAMSLLQSLQRGHFGTWMAATNCLQDEPTNHLDLPSILWLQGYLKTLEDKTVVLVSHDRAFLDETAQEIILLRHNRLAYHTGRHSQPETSKN